MKVLFIIATMFALAGCITVEVKQVDPTTDTGKPFVAPFKAGLLEIFQDHAPESDIARQAKLLVEMLPGAIPREDRVRLVDMVPYFWSRLKDEAPSARPALQMATHAVRKHVTNQLAAGRVTLSDEYVTGDIVDAWTEVLMQIKAAEYKNDKLGI